MNTLYVLMMLLFAGICIGCVAAFITGFRTSNNPLGGTIKVEVIHTYPAETHSPMEVDPTLQQDLIQTQSEYPSFDAALSGLNEFMTTGTLYGEGGGDN